MDALLPRCYPLMFKLAAAVGRGNMLRMPLTLRDRLCAAVALFQAVRLYDLGLMGLGHAAADEGSKRWLRLQWASPMRPVTFMLPLCG